MSRLRPVDLLNQELDIALSYPEAYKKNNKLNDKQYLEKLEELKNRIAMSKQGKRSRNKGNSYERTIAKVFNDKYGTLLVRTPMSGGFHKKKESELKGDIINIDPDFDFKLQIECKNQASWRVKEWLTQSETEARANRIPVLIMHRHKEIIDGKVQEKAEDYVVLKLSDFVELVDKSKVVIPKTKQNSKLRRK